MQINGVDYGRAQLGTGREYSKKQNRFKGGNGVVRVRDKEVEDELVTYTLMRVPYTQFQSLNNFLRNTANYSASTFQVVDDWGMVFTVRWWDSRLRFKEKAGRLFEVTVTFRVEN